jgi:hypothetical protein
MRIQDLRRSPSSLNAPGLNAPDPTWDPSSPRYPASTIQHQATAHKKHGSKGVAQRQGGARSYRESRAFLSISGVVRGLPVSGLSAWRRQRCNFLRSSRIRVHPTPATSTMPPKFDPNEIKVGACPSCSRGCGWSPPPARCPSGLRPPPRAFPCRPLGPCFLGAVGRWAALPGLVLFGPHL